MQSQIRKSCIASAVALGLLAAAGSSFAADGSSSEIVQARQEAQISTTYALSPHLRANDITVAVAGGTATLTGHVGEEVDSELAAQIALGVDGIKKIDNQLVVSPDSKPKTATADRSFGEFVDDATITTAVKSKLLWSKHAEGMAANVDTLRGKVTLRGTAESSAHKEAAGRLARNTRGVTMVDNGIVVQAPKTKAQNQTVGQSVSDAWITAKVKSSLAYSTHVDGSAISVSTENGVVNLSGQASSSAARALAVELAENIRGVRSVQATKLTSL
ncbi:MAG: BON domain-containing protein [Xanthomonadaceae bacterium]|nr:BON domain-containing protein [Xanthomonadaceae bacterium]